MDKRSRKKPPGVNLEENLGGITKISMGGTLEGILEEDNDGPRKKLQKESRVKNPRSPYFDSSSSFV